MKKTKLMSLVLALVMLLGVAMPVFAAEDDVEAPVGTIDETKTSDTVPTSTTVNVYKLEAESYNSPRQWDHNGGKLSEGQLAQLGTGVKGLKGVVFSYYEVTAAQLETLKVSKPATAEKVKEVLGGDFTQEPTKLTKTDSDGMATVSLPNGNYWFIETEAPANVTTDGSHAVPFALTLPQVNLKKMKKVNL